MDNIVHNFFDNFNSEQFWSNLGIIIVYILLGLTVFLCLLFELKQLINNPKSIKKVLFQFVSGFALSCICIMVAPSKMPADFLAELPSQKHIKHLNKEAADWSEDQPEWVINGTNRYAEFKGEYGKAIKQYAPTQFEAGKKELTWFDKLIEPFINSQAPSIYEDVNACGVKIIGGSLILFYVLGLIAVCSILFGAIASKLIKN